MRRDRIRFPEVALTTATLAACSGGGVVTTLPDARVAASATPSVQFFYHDEQGCTLFYPPEFTPASVICEDHGDPTPPREFVTKFELYDTNATNKQPSLTIAAFHSNPGGFRVTGTVFAATQVVVAESPASLTSTSSALDLSYFLTPYYDPAALLVPGTRFACTIFDGATLLGSSSATVPAGGGIGCHGFSGSGGFQSAETTGPSIAEIPLPTTIDANSIYTTILSF